MRTERRTDSHDKAKPNTCFSKFWERAYKRQQAMPLDYYKTLSSVC
jgi:hypothetical protein